jgi:hypothetical protein
MFVDFGLVITNCFGSIFHWCMVTQSWGLEYLESETRLIVFGTRLIEFGTRLFVSGTRLFESGTRQFASGTRLLESGIRFLEPGALGTQHMHTCIVLYLCVLFS